MGEEFGDGLRATPQGPNCWGGEKAKEFREFWVTRYTEDWTVESYDIFGTSPCIIEDLIERVGVCGGWHFAMIKITAECSLGEFFPGYQVG